MDLLSKKHILTTHTVDEGDCGSHGCSGHSHREIRCSCGFVSRVPEFVMGRDRPSFGPKERHIQDILLAQLQIEVG